MTADATLTVRSPADLISAVPYLLGFHPTDSLTVVAVRGRRVIFAARHDLSEPGNPDADGEARHVAAVVARQGVHGATIIGYGSADRVTPAVLRLADALRGIGVTVLDVLRVTAGRYWSYLCADPACCPPEGLPCDPASVVAATATYAGHVALPDRDSLAALLAPVTGAARDSMMAATLTAERRLTELVAAAPADTTPADTGAAAILRVGRVAVRGAVRRHRYGGRLSDDEAAWLAVLVRHLPVRDHAWERTGDEPWHVSLWAEVVRRAEPRYVPAPACLLAFAAWRAGQGALAYVAVQRAKEHEPDYPMAQLLDDVLRYALPPSSADGWPRTARRRHRRRGRASSR